MTLIDRLRAYAAAANALAARQDGVREAWQPIKTAPKDGSEVLLGFAGSADMDFYRWNADIARSSSEPEREGWCDRFTDPPHETPTHWIMIEPPS